MQGYQTILFDLDGTLTDSAPGITNSVAYALKKYGISTPDPSVLQHFVGPPLTESFCKYYGFCAEQAVEAVEFYREYYRETGIFENSVYDGIMPLLSRLREFGRRLAVATSKPEVFAKQILTHFGLADSFTYIAGATLDGSRVGKADVIAYALSEIGVAAGADVVMVGDREHDVLGARANGIASIGVLFGYGSRRELEQAGATHLAAAPAEIGQIALG